MDKLCIWINFLPGYECLNSLPTVDKCDSSAAEKVEFAFSILNVSVWT